MSLPKYLPFASGQWRLNLGMKPLNLAEWIEIDEHFITELLLKEELLNTRHFDVFADIEGSKASQQEALQLILDHLLNYFPQHYQRFDSKIENITTGQIWDINDFETSPLDLAGRLVQEDLTLLQPSPEGYVLVAASVCFPLRWNLKEKIGHPLTKIHQPVPNYQAKLQRPVDNIFDRIQPNNPIWRMNWSLVDSPELFLAQERGKHDIDARITAKNAGETLWIRVERQALRRLPQTGAVLFVVHTYINPLKVLEEDSTIAKNLAAAIQQIPTTMQSYKNILPIRDAVLGYLDGLN